MKILLLGLIGGVALCAAAAGDARAQVSPFDFPSSNPPYHWSNESGTSDDWGRCSHRDRHEAEQTLRSCTHIINERNGGEITAAAYYFRGLEYELLGDSDHARPEFENAYRWFTIAMGSDRSNPEPRANRAVVLMHLGRFDEALADYDAAIAATGRSYAYAGTRVHPNVADAGNTQVPYYLMARGAVSFRRQDWTSAIAAFDHAGDLAPRNGDAQLYRCEARAAAGSDLEAADAACEHAIELNEAAPYSYFSRGFLRFKRGDFAGAAEDFARAANSDQGTDLALYALGVATVHLGRIEEGQAMIAKANEHLSPFDIAYYAGAGLRP